MTESDFNKQLLYTKKLDAIRTDLASIVSKLSSREKYKLDGAMTPELLLSTAEDVVEADEVALEALKDRVATLVKQLNDLEKPTMSKGD